MSHLFHLLVLYGLGAIAAFVFLVVLARGMRRQADGKPDSRD